MHAPFLRCRGIYSAASLHTIKRVLIAFQRNQSCPAMVGQVRPCPLEEGYHAVAEADQVEDVDDQPCDPGEKAGHFHQPQVNQSVGTSYGGKVALVKVAERLMLLFARDALCNERGHIAAFLHGNGGNTGERLAVLRDGGGVADDEDVGMAGKREVAFYLDTT